MSEGSDFKSGRIRDNLFRELRKTDINKFNSVVKDYVERYQDEVDFNIKETAILHCKDRGPLFVLRAYFVLDDTVNAVGVLLHFADRLVNNPMPKYVSNAWKMAIDLHYSFESLTEMQKKRILFAIDHLLTVEEANNFKQLHHITFK